MKTGIMQTFLWVSASALAFYVAILLLLYVFQSGMMYHPVKQIYQTPKAIQLEYEDVYFESGKGGQIHGWFIPSRQARATVLLSHGNAGNISDRLETLRILNRLHLNVLIYDYAGYGKSEGSPSEETTYQNAYSAWNYLSVEKQIPSGKIILMGRSLGGAVAAWLASRTEPAALVLESTFTSAVDLAEEIYPFLPVRMLMKFEYPTASYLPNVSVPIMILHSEDDQLVPFHHGRELYDIANDPKTFFKMNGAHGNSHVVTGEEYIEALDEFVSSALTSK